MIFEFGKHEIEIYDNIQDLPILTFQKFNKYQMMASEIGNDFEDYDRRTAKTIAFLDKGMVKEARQELENRRIAVFNAYREFTPVGYSFAVLIRRIDKKEYNKKTSEEIDDILKHLEKIGFDFKTSIEKLKEVKKKIDQQLLVYYPKFFPKNQNKDILALRAKRVNYLLDLIIEKKESIKEEVFEVEKEILENDTPHVWNVHIENNMERVLEVDFNKFAIQVTELSNQRLEDMTTFRFYATVEYLKEKNKKQ